LGTAQHRLPNIVHAAVVSAPPRQTPISSMALNEQRSQDSSGGLKKPEANSFLHEVQQVRCWALRREDGRHFPRNMCLWVCNTKTMHARILKADVGTGNFPWGSVG